MDIINFIERFPDESSCKQYFKELQRQLRYKRCCTVWSVMCRIRETMDKRGSLYTLEGMVEFNEDYFTTETKDRDKKNLKRGKSCQKQTNVKVIARSTPLEDLETGKTSKHYRYFKMKVLGSHELAQVNEVIEENFAETSIVFSDKNTSYIDIAQYVDVHIPDKSTKETTVKTLPWVHIAISKAKRNLLGVYYKIKSKYLQLYLDEFCYKLNWRYFGNRLFGRVAIVMADNYWYNKD